MAKPTKLEKRAGMPSGSSRSAKPERDPFYKVEAGEIIGWREGKKLEGTFLKVRENSNGSLLDIRDAEGKRETWGCPAILATKLEDFERGDRIRVECLGKVETASGRLAWDFDVYRAPASSGGTQEEMPF